MATRGPDPTNKTDEIVATLSEYERPFMGTGELANELGYDSNPGVTKHLKRAVDQNRIKQTTISGYNVWYLPGLVPESQIEQATGPATGGGGNNGGTDTTKQTNGLLPSVSDEDRTEMLFPGLLLVILLGFLGWRTYQTARARLINGPVVDTDDWAVSLPGLAVIGVIGGFVVATIGFAAYLFMYAYTAATGGNITLALSYALGIVGMFAALAYAGGVIGAPARLLSRFFGGETA